MTRSEKRRLAEKLAKDIDATMTPATSGNTFYFRKRLPTLDPKEAVTALKQMAAKITDRKWTVTNAATPKPDNDDGTTTITIIAAPGPKCKRVECSNPSINAGYCFRHQFLIGREELAAADRRTAPLRGQPRYGYVAAPVETPKRCLDCDAEGETVGHMGCPYPGRYSERG